MIGARMRRIGWRGAAAAVGAAAVGALVAGALLGGGTTANAQSASLSLSLSGVEPLSLGHYEGWAIFGDDKVSTGKFNVADDGSLVSLSGSPLSSFEADASGSDMIVITIEPEGDTDAIPSGIVLLAGSLSGSTAALSFPIDLSGVAGGYILATPTDDDTDTTNDVAGLWFLDPGAGPGPALTLPTLGEGWVWEGWGVTQGTPLSSGRFTDVASADLAAPFSGAGSGPPFPGEDFLNNLPGGVTPPVNLADGASTIVLSLEPDLNGVDPTGDAPFAIKPLVHGVPENLADHTLTGMDQNLGTVPSGSASVSGAAAPVEPPAVEPPAAGPPAADPPAALPNTGSGGFGDTDGGWSAWQLAALAAAAAIAFGVVVRFRMARARVRDD